MRTSVIVLAAITGISFGAGGCIVQVSGGSCANGILDGTETDVDCGGLCAPCSDGRRCGVNTDCANGSCSTVNGQRLCAAQQPGATCTDNMKNGQETDVDCGGPQCPPCAVSRACLVGADCVSRSCSATTHVCLAPACTDGVQNGDETGLDCGGSCPPCGHKTGSPLTTTPDLINTPKFPIKPGVGVSFTAGTPGFAIAASVGTPTAGQPGSTWSLTWIGDQSATNPYHTFYGSIWSQGSFQSITPGCAANACTLEGDDLISQPGMVGGGWTRVDFDSSFINAATPEGFTFVVVPTNAPMNTNHEPVYFDLYIDGVGGVTAPFVKYPDANNGGALTSPSANLFGLRTN